MNSERGGILVGWLLVLAGGALLSTIESNSAPRVEAKDWHGWSGVFRAAGPTKAALAADVAWLQLNAAWEARDASAVRSLLGVALAAEPESAYFRRNAARMLAYDLPAWRVAAEPDAPSSIVRSWYERAADEALALLVESRDPDLLVEAANIMLYGRRDRAAAAGLYRAAAELPGAAWHAGRIHAQLLRELGRDREALEWLRAWLPRLPGDDLSAQRDLVEARIAELELELRSRGEPL